MSLLKSFWRRSNRKYLAFDRKYLAFDRKHLAFDRKYLAFDRKYLAFDRKYLAFDRKYFAFDCKYIAFTRKYLAFDRTRYIVLRITTIKSITTAADVNYCFFFIGRCKSHPPESIFPCLHVSTAGVVSVPEKVDVGSISPRAFRRRIVRYWRPLGYRAIQLGKSPQGCVYTLVRIHRCTKYTVFSFSPSLIA